MSISYYLTFSKEMSPDIEEILEIKELYEESNQPCPKEIISFFQKLLPGYEIDEIDEDLILDEACSVDVPYNKRDLSEQVIFEIDVNDIPKEVRYIRFCMSF